MQNREASALRTNRLDDPIYDLDDTAAIARTVLEQIRRGWGNPCGKPGHTHRIGDAYASWTHGDDVVTVYGPPRTLATIESAAKTMGFSGQQPRSGRLELTPRRG